MAQPSVRVRIADMLDAIATVEDLIDGIHFDIYTSLSLRGQRRGVERCVEIVSEASRHIPQDLKSRYPAIPWRRIRDIGNVLRHGYSSVDDRIIWRVATRSLPELAIALNDMLASLPPDTDE